MINKHVAYAWKESHPFALDIPDWLSMVQYWHENVHVATTDAAIRYAIAATYPGYGDQPTLGSSPLIFLHLLDIEDSSDLRAAVRKCGL